MNIEAAITRAAMAFQRGDHATVECECVEVISKYPDHPDATHLLGLARRALGDPDQALALIERSLELDPARAEFFTNYSNLLRSLNRIPDAEIALRQALVLDPGARNARLALARLLENAGIGDAAIDEARVLLESNENDAEALVVLAMALASVDRYEESAAGYERALEIRPDYAIAHYNYAVLLCRQGEAERALAELDEAERLGLRGSGLLYNRATALMMLARHKDAEAALNEALDIEPEHVDAQHLLAKLRFMRGDDDFTRRLRGVERPNLVLLHGDLLRRAGRLDEALMLVQELHHSYPDSPSLATNLAVLLQERGNLEEAVGHARRAAVAQPHDTNAVENLVAILLQLGKPDEAEPHIRRCRERYPLDQRWFTYEATAARLTGDPRYEELYDYDRFVRGYDLQPPPGYSSIDEFHQALIPVLHDRHSLAAHPLDQSLRLGTQTPRSLLTDPDPVIRSLIEALAAPIEAYRGAIGHDPDHPFLERNTGDSQIVGCWSVRLRPGGYHVNHIHPEGWISSAYYVDVPDSVEESKDHSGWLKFGEPLMPTPGAEPAHFEQPRAGRLVLFPSYMWHGTVPFDAEAHRMTVAFDVVTREAKP